MESIVRLALSPDENAKVTPLEILKDFADATRNWVYLEHASRHYAEEKDVPALVMRRRVPPSTYVDLAFANASPATNRIELVLLDEPGPENQLNAEERSQVIETFLNDLQDHLQARPDHISLHVERGTVDVPNPST